MAMFTTRKDFVEIEGTLYQILRVVREDLKPIVDTWKESLLADKVFKQNGAYYFVREVPEAELVPEEATALTENKTEGNEEVRGKEN